MKFDLKLALQFLATTEMRLINDTELDFFAGVDNEEALIREVDVLDIIIVLDGTKINLVSGEHMDKVQTFDLREG
jgi:hypothetical protein